MIFIMQYFICAVAVEYGVLLCRLYDEGINAKLWRLL